MSQSILKSIPFFSELTEKELAVFEPHARVKFFRAGAVLGEEETLSLQCHIIQSGKVEVLKNPGEANETVLATLGENEFFGEMAFLSGAPRSATIRVTEDMSTMSFSVPAVDSIGHEHPAIALKIYRQWLNKSIEHIRSMNVALSEQ